MNTETPVISHLSMRDDLAQPRRSLPTRGTEHAHGNDGERDGIWLITLDQSIVSIVAEVLKGHWVIPLRDLRDLGSHLSGEGQALAVVDLDANPRLMLAELERLTSRFPAARVIALANAVGSDLLLEAMQAGVRRVVAKDQIRAELGPIVTRLGPGVSDPGASSGDIITILSASGGCGATTIAANLATELAQRNENQPALLIDLDCIYGSLATYFGLAPRYAIDHLLHYEGVPDIDLLRSTTTVHDDHVHVLASPASPRPPRPQVPDFARLSEVLSLASRAYSYTVVDAPRLTHEVTADLVNSSSNVLLLFQLTVKDLRFAREMIDALDDAGVPRHHVVPVANRFVRRPPISLEDATKVLGGLTIRTLRNDFPAALEGVNFGKTLAQAAPRSHLRRDLQEIVESLVAARG
jgi:pilus assembly protein CpaE